MDGHNPNPYDPEAKSTTQLPLKISPEDQKVIDECNREAFFSRCLPFSICLGSGVALAVRSGYLKPHPSWGPTPKVMAAVFFGYFAGKLSYQQKCAEKLMAIPNSPLGAMLRARKQRGGGGVFQDPLTFDMPGYTMPEENPQDKYRDDISPRTFTDLDTDRPYNQGLDDSFRLNVDSPQRTEDFVLPPQAPTSNSYEEMRRRNREDFDNKTRNFRERHLPSSGEQPRQYQPPQPPPSTGPEPFDRYRPTNIYGDIFEK